MNINYEELISELDVAMSKLARGSINRQVFADVVIAILASYGVDGSGGFEVGG